MNPGLVAMQRAPRCNARTRSGGRCKKAALRGKKRCRLHGGYLTGGPVGNQHALKHGYYSRSRAEARRWAAEELKRMRPELKQIDELAAELGFELPRRERRRRRAGRD